MEMFIANSVYCPVYSVLKECLIVVKRRLSHFSAISWREQVNIQRDDGEVRFLLHQCV
jgi:hypothetical protein